MFENTKVLIVDDEEKARLYLASILSELHPEIEIQLASIPAECMFLLKKQSFDVIFLDVEMPGMTGLEMLSKIRLSRSDIPVIFVSAYKRAEFIQKALRLNAVDYIDKPVNPSELEQALIKALASNKNDNINTDKFCLVTSIGEMFVRFEDIIYFESFKRYSIAHFKDSSQKIVRSNLEILDKKLPSKWFLRVSRQHIINLSFIKFVSKTNKTITLATGTSQIELERIYPRIIPELIEKFKL